MSQGQRPPSRPGLSSPRHSSRQTALLLASVLQAGPRVFLSRLHPYTCQSETSLLVGRNVQQNRNGFSYVSCAWDKGSHLLRRPCRLTGLSAPLGKGCKPI